MGGGIRCGFGRGEGAGVVTDPGCHFHGDEPVPADCYRLCVECGHAFTAAELLAEHNRVLARLEFIAAQERDGVPTWGKYGEWVGAFFPDMPAVLEADPGAVGICPLCTHDF